MAGIYDWLERRRRMEPDPVEEYGKWADVVQGYNASRVPQMQALEEQSSARIAELLNPPAMFADTSRMAAEEAAGRGISGSPAGAAIGVRMTDEERLKRIALGSQLLSAAAGRYPTQQFAPPGDFYMTPAQKEQSRLGWAEIQLERDRLKKEIAGQGGGTTTIRTGMPGLAAASAQVEPLPANPGYTWAPTPQDMAQYIAPQAAPDVSEYFNYG